MQIPRPADLPVTRIKTDFCIIGGGLAGVCAAISAARNGAQVVLVQDRSVLGGNASSEIKMHVVGADCHGSRPGARETGLLEEFRLEDAYRNPQRVYSLWDILLYEKVTNEPNITLLLESHCHGCITTEADGRKRITTAKVIRTVTEEQFEIEADLFADCSGDGRLGAEAGADYRIGREATSDYGESLALSEADGQTLGNSILFTSRKGDHPAPFIAPSWARKFSKGDFRLRPIKGYEYGYWWSEWGGHLSTITGYDQIRHECLRIGLGVWDYIKNSGDHPDAANYTLDWLGAIPGKRESRRFLGHHMLIEQDVMTGQTFDDQVAYGGWWLDLHPPIGIDARDEEPCVQHHTPHLFGIPLRALHSRNVENLLFAGRNISATHAAFASTRVMGTCAVMGQAIGTTAAELVRRKAPAATAEMDADVIRSIQQCLLRDDAFLPGLRNEDPADLARDAVCRASCEALERSAGQVLTGVARTVEPEWGPWADPTPNHWESGHLPAWIELELPTIQTIKEIQLTFDSGLQRELTLTPSDFVTSQTVRGPQPELVKDYDIVFDDEEVLAIRGNYLRKRIHVLDQALEVKRVRVQVHATNGVSTARIFEVRLYEGVHSARSLK